jgi:hypothetical protein
VTNDHDPARSGTTSVVCGYDAKRSDGVGTAVQVHMQIGGARAEYDALKKSSSAQGYTTSDRSGIGDEAFTFSATAAGLNYLVSIKGDMMLDIAAPSSFEQEVTLANLLFAR